MEIGLHHLETPEDPDGIHDTKVINGRFVAVDLVDGATPVNLYFQCDAGGLGRLRQVKAELEKAETLLVEAVRPEWINGFFVGDGIDRSDPDVRAWLAESDVTGR